MANNPLLGRLLSEHGRADYQGRARFKGRAFLGCGAIFILPLICGLWGSIAYFTSNRNGDAAAGLAVSLALVVISLGFPGLFLLLIRLSPRWLTKYKCELYEHGFALKTPFKSQTCLWTEIERVNPMLLTTPANRAATPAGDFQNAGDTEYGGIYEVYKRDGTKILVSRQYSEIARIDDALKPYCKETPNW